MVDKYSSKISRSTFCRRFTELADCNQPNVNTDNTLSFDKTRSNDESAVEKQKAALVNEFFYREQKRLFRILRERLKEKRNQYERSQRRQGTHEKPTKCKTDRSPGKQHVKPDCE